MPNTTLFSDSSDTATTSETDVSTASTTTGSPGIPPNRSQVSAVAAPDTPAELEAADVVAWLRTHTDFFLEYPELLAILALPSESGTTISFAQRQASVLRKRNSDLRGRLQALLANAQTNDALFEKTRTLSVTLQRAESATMLNDALGHDLVEAFAADHLACYLREDAVTEAIIGKDPGAQNGGVDATAPHSKHNLLHWVTEYPLQELFDADSARCVTLRTRELDALFPARQSRDEGSAVLIPLPNSDGMLAIGSDNRERFNNDMGMLFVDFIGELVDVTVQRLLRASAQGTAAADSLLALETPAPKTAPLFSKLDG